MKAAILIMLSFLFSGCVAKIDDALPAITAQSFSYTRTGKFSSTTIKAEGLKTDAEKVRAEKILLRHSNAWIPNVEIDVVGYERAKRAEEK